MQSSAPPQSTSPPSDSPSATASATVPTPATTSESVRATTAPAVAPPAGTFGEPPSEEPLAPATGTGRRHTSRSNRTNRKGHYSCDFCRVRKLRCDRPLPCTNCVSRGKKCSFVPGAGQVHIQSQSQNQGQGQGQNVSTLSGPQGAVTITNTDPTSKSNTIDATNHTQLPHQTLPSQAVPSSSTHNVPSNPPGSQGSLLAEIQALRRLAQDLEKRVASGNDPSISSFTPPTLTPSSARFDIGPTRAGLSSDIGEVGEVVAQLERVSMGQVSHGPIFVDAFVFKTERIQVIPRAPSYIAQSGKPTRCVLLPLHEEAKVLVDKFMKSVSYIYRVVHHPSLPGVVDDLYRQISGQAPIRPGHLVLLLSIIATATHVWAPTDGQTGSSSLLFSSAAQANAQTPMWVKATHDVLNARQSCPAPSLETVQGIVILSFLISNIEGVSLRYRALISTGLLLGRELGLHRLDHPSNATAATTLEAEMGRRVWWYLVATDWLMAARSGGPGEGVYLANPDHMMVKKPRNINDDDLPNNFPHLDPPLSQPTEMSYFIQRLRLAEISRRIIDHNSMVSPGAGRPMHNAHIVAMDVELDRMLRDVPAFFRLENYDRHVDPDATQTFLHAYLLNSLIYTVRCKLHINYLSHGPDNGNPAYSFSRESCLNAARQLLRGELQLMSTEHPFVETRLHMAGVLYGVFMASIVLLMDAYVTGSPLDETRRAEVNEALRIVEDAKGHSLAAASLHESLTNVLTKHRARLQQQYHQHQLDYSHQQQSHQQHHYQHQFTPHQIARIPSDANEMAHLHPRPDPMAFVTGPSEAMVKELSMVDPMGANMVTQSTFGDNPPQYDNQLAQGLEALMEHNGFQWDDLLSGIDSTSFF